MKLVTSSEMRLLERRAVDTGVSLADLMNNAGQAVASQLTSIFEPIQEKRVLVLAGPGNNGGDGLIAARYLKAAGALVDVYMMGSRETNDGVYREALASGLTPIELRLDAGLDRLEEILNEADIVVDAVFGTGFDRQISDNMATPLRLVSRIKTFRPDLTIIALDVPSGLDADSGAVDKATLPADYTISLANPKRGFFLFPGADYTGEILIADIGIPENLDADIKTELMTEDTTRDRLPERRSDANKGSFGRLMVAAGSPEYTGAASLSCLGAYRAGAGLVTLALRESLHTLLGSKLIETTFLPMPETTQGGEISADAAPIIKARLERYGVLAIGPGLGQAPDTVKFIIDVLSDLPSTVKVVADADALNALALTEEWWRGFSRLAVLTPHPGEMSRLSGMSIDDIQADRIEIARKFAKLWDKIVVLKGAHTVIASPDGRVAVAPNANPGLATAGTGDVLTGVIAGLMAQGASDFDAACAGVYIHAMAAETVRQNLGDCGMIASDLLPQLPRAIKTLKEHVHAACG